VRIFALFGLFLTGCIAPPNGDLEPARGRIDESLQPAFTELKAALDEGSDEVARAVLARLRPRCQDPLSRQIVEGYDRILAGRAIRDSIEASSVIVEVEGGFEVNLSLQFHGDQDLVLSPGYIRVEWTAWCIDTIGRQSAQVGGRVIPEASVWELPAGEIVVVGLGVDSLQIGEGVLAVRVEWRISLAAGSALVGTERFPAQGLQVQDGVIVRLSRDLPTGSIEPEELFRYALSDSVKLPALLERAVRILPSRYGEALDLLAEMQAEFSPSALKSMIPVLAWLTGSSGITATGEEWRSWLLDRLLMKEQTRDLDLPDVSGR